MLFVIFAVVALLLLFLVPVRREVLIEGKFENEESGWSFSNFSTPYRVFNFSKYCRSCFDEWQRTGKKPELMYSVCHAGVRKRAIKFGSFVPTQGAMVKIATYKSLFGMTIGYRVEPSDYVWVCPFDEELRLEALEKGFADVKKYREVREKEWKEEFWQEAMQEHGISHEEAELLRPLPRFMASLEKEAKRKGKTYFEVKEAFENKMKKPSYLTEFCYYMTANTDSIVDQFIAEGSLSPDWHEHLNKCWWCHGFFVRTVGEKSLQSVEEVEQAAHLRPESTIFAEEVQSRYNLTVEEYNKRTQENWVLTYGDETCFTVKERITYAKGEKLPLDRMRHTDSCVGCRRMIAADREEVLATGQIGGRL